MTSHSDFLAGDLVTWQSQASGRQTKKTGVIFYTVAAGERMDKTKAQAKLKAAGYGSQATWATDFDGMARKEASYLVVVPGTSGAGGRLPRVYWPRASGLSLARPS
jgi:hypothetical protein